MNIQERLFELRDSKYKEFNSKLIPTVDPDTQIGIRTPDIRNLAREIASSPEAEEFLKALPHKYYEENNLHGFLIERLGDYDRVICEIERFLPYIDNWATCDMISPKIFKKNTAKLLIKIKEWVRSEHTYTVRFALGMLMRFYLDSEFDPEYLEIAAGVKSEEYYVNMMTAWFFATALAKQYDAAVVYIEEKRLSPWVHNKAISKSRESLRVTPEHKAYLKTLKI